MTSLGSHRGASDRQPADPSLTDGSKGLRGWRICDSRFRRLHRSVHADASADPQPPVPSALVVVNLTIGRLLTVAGRAEETSLRLRAGWSDSLRGLWSVVGVVRVSRNCWVHGARSTSWRTSTGVPCVCERTPLGHGQRRCWFGRVPTAGRAVASAAGPVPELLGEAGVAAGGVVAAQCLAGRVGVALSVPAAAGPEQLSPDRYTANTVVRDSELFQTVQK